MPESWEGEQRVVVEGELLMREIEILQAKGNPRLLRTFFYLVRALDVELDFSQARVPNELELVALYQASRDIGARMVTAYSEMMTKARRRALSEQ